MAKAYEELAYHRTRMGELLLRRRRVAGLGDLDIYEVKLGDELLMSSLLTASERALADLTVTAAAGDELAVLIGGLGLGYTARAALGYSTVESVTVVEIFPEVVEWHEKGLVPLADKLVGEPRCRIVRADFFALLMDPAGDDYDVILIDIDHAPDSRLHTDHGRFYGEAGLAGAAARLRPGGAFGFWSSGPVNEPFLTGLGEVFGKVVTHDVEVMNPLIGENQLDTIYVGTDPG